jgi:hypothetical protein
MKVGDTVLHVSGSDENVREVVLSELRTNWFVASGVDRGFNTTWCGWGKVFPLDQPDAADAAIVRECDRQIADLENQISKIVERRAVVMARGRVAP